MARQALNRKKNVSVFYRNTFLLEELQKDALFILLLTLRISQTASRGSLVVGFSLSGLIIFLDLIESEVLLSCLRMFFSGICVMGQMNNFQNSHLFI